MLKKILFFIPFFIWTSHAQDSAKLNDFEPVHILAAVKFPINQINPQDLFTLQIFQNIVETFGPDGINLDAYQLEHIKKTYLYLIFLTKLEKVKKDPQFAVYRNDFASFLEDNGQAAPHIPTEKLLNSKGWLQVTIDSQDIINSTMWQLFCKSMIADINTYLIVGLKLIHNCEKQEFNYIPHFETSYYNKDYVQIRNINAVVRIKIELEQQIQQRYLQSCNDWKQFLKKTPKSTSQLETELLVFQKTDFYQKTHNMHNLMGTQAKFNAHQTITHQDLLSAPALQSPLKEYVFGFFLLYELYGQLTSFMHEQNLDQVITLCASSKLSPNVFPYTSDDYILISELLAGKNIIQDKPTNSIHPTPTTFKPEDVRNIKDWINPTRHSTQQYMQSKITPKKTVQAQSFLSFLSDIKNDVVQAADDIKHGVEKACDAVKDVAETVAYGIAGFTLTIVGQDTEGNKLMKKSTAELKQATHDLESSINDFGSALKEGIIAPVGELTGDIVGFITDDKNVGADIDTIVTNCSDALVNIAEAAVDTAAISVMYVYTLPEQIIKTLIETMVAGVLAIWDQQAALNICQSILRSLVTTFMMVAQVTKEDFQVIMSSLGTFMNSVTTLFNDLLREITFIVVSVGTTFADIAGADINIAHAANSAADTAYNAINQHRAIINQVIGVAVMIGADIATGGAATAGEVAIDAELEASLDATAAQAQTVVDTAQSEVDEAEEELDQAQTAEEKEAAKTKLNDAKAKLKTAQNQQEQILKNIKETKEQAQDAAREAKEEKEAPEKFLGNTRLRIKKFFRAYKRFLMKNKDIVTGSFGRSGRFFKGFKDIPSTDLSAAEKWSSFKNFLKEPYPNKTQLLDSIQTRTASFINRVKSIPDQANSILEDGKNFITRDSFGKASQSSLKLSKNIENLTQAQQEFDQALQNYNAATVNPQEFATQQENLLNATKKLRQAELEVEKSSKQFSENFKELGSQEKDLVKNPLNKMKDNAEQEIKDAQEELNTADSATKKIAQRKLTQAQKRLKLIDDAMQENIPDAVTPQASTTSISQQLSDKLGDALDYLKSKGKDFQNLFTKNSTLAEQAEANLTKEEEQLNDLNTTLKDQKAKLEEDPTNTTFQKDVQTTEAKIKQQEKEVRKLKEYAKERRTIADETTKETASRYLKNAFSPIGMFMNIAFNFTSIIGGYNQDQKNLLQQKQQEENIQELWRFNTNSKISTTYTDIGYLDELAEKQKASIGNQILNLSLSQNYSYVNLEKFEQTVLQTLAMIYSLELYPNASTGLMPANIGTLWGLTSNYLNLYPSEGFYVTTTGRPDFNYSQEIAQAPHLLTETAKTKTKQWFNQRCTGIDSINTNGTLKQPTDPLTVAIDLKFLYTLDSEFYVGIYMGGNYHDYFAKTYLAALLGTTIDKLAQAYSELTNKTTAYPFNLRLIDLNETYLAKMIVIYRESGMDQLKIGVYEQNLTNNEWLFKQTLPPTMQLNQDHIYSLSATLDATSLNIQISADHNPQTMITKKIPVTPINNQRMYGIIASSAAIEWKQINPVTHPQIVPNVRKPQKLILEKERNKNNKMIEQEAINQIFGGKSITLISKHRARIFGQYIYASVQTDVAKIIPKNPADLLVFATNTNGTITDIGKAPNSFKDSTTNVLVSLVTGHVFDQTFKCIATIPHAWQNYSNPRSGFGPFLPTLQKTIEQQQQLVFSKLQYINFGPSFKLNALSLNALENTVYVYTCDQTLTDASLKPFTDYVVFAPDITNDQTKITLGLPPTASNVATMVSLITGNVYEKNTKLTKGQIPVPTTTLNINAIATYLKQNLSAYSSIILDQTTAYQAITQEKTENQNNAAIESVSTNGTMGTNKDWFKQGKTFHLKFNFSRFNLADRQKQAAASYKIQFNPPAKV